MSSDTKTTLVTFLVALLFISSLPIILINSVAWIRFESRYRRWSSERMPSVPFDFRARWWRARSTPHSNPDVERARRVLQFSYLAMLIPFGLFISLELVLSLMR